VTVFLPPWSKNLRKHGDSQTVLQMCLFGLSLLFALAAIMQDDAIMPSEVYGEWVTQYPAEWWAFLIMGASIVYLIGIVINGHWRWSPVFRTAGAAAHVTVFAAFVKGAYGAIYGDFFVLICLVIGICHAVFLAWNIADLARAFGRTD
jgi:hypothetical protein